jgi:hypothetical protein
MRFRIDLRRPYAHYADRGNGARFHVLVDGERRGLHAVRDTNDFWSADIAGVPLVQHLWGHERLEQWLAANVDADLLLPRPIAAQFELEV